MTDDSTTDTPNDDQTDSDHDEGRQTFDAEYVRKLREQSAKYRTAAKANADAAKRLADLENSQKSEIQKAMDRADAAERDLAARTRENLRLQVASKHGITGDHLDLLHGDDEASLEANAVKITKLIGNGRKPIVPAEGKTPKEPAASEEHAFASRLFRGRSD